MTPLASVCLVPQFKRPWDLNTTFLVVSRRGNYSDLGLPGGKIDVGENPRDAAARELYEETGLVPAHISTHPIFVGPCDVPNRETIYVACYHVEVDPRLQPRAMEPNTWVGWVPFSRLLKENGTFYRYNRLLAADLGLF